MSSSGLLPENLAIKARQISATMAHRLADSEVMSTALKQASLVSEYPHSWGGVSLFGGHAGHALVFQYASRILTESADHWLRCARQSLREASLSTQVRPLIEYGLGYGTTGLAFAVAECEADEPRYRTSLRKLHLDLAEQIGHIPVGAEGDGVAPGDYDVVQGGAGILGYLVSIPSPEGHVVQGIRRLVENLVWLCSKPRENTRRPWCIMPAKYPTPEDAEHSPYGYIDLGLAHGLSGPIAALSLAWTAGHRYPGMHGAIQDAAAMLSDATDQDDSGPNWPRSLRLDVLGQPVVEPSIMGRSTWCYGAPGICSALLDAANAISDPSLKATAIDGFEGALRRLREPETQHLRSPTLCHGLAGLLMICRKFAITTNSKMAKEALVEIVERLLDHCDLDLPLVVQDIEGPNINIDSPGLLDGAAGVALALWSVSTSVGARWQRALLIG